LPTLSSLEQGQPLILYVSATHSAISKALVAEKETTHNGKTAKQQFLMHFVPEVLTQPKMFDPEMEKICYSVIMSAWKLWHYFEAHIIKVLTNQLLTISLAIEIALEESVNRQWIYQNTLSTLKSEV
jgi:hypothetical protein